MSAAIKGKTEQDDGNKTPELNNPSLLLLIEKL
jgi:hypothetical protein